MPSPSWTSTARCRTSSRVWCCSRPSCSTTGCIPAMRRPHDRETDPAVTLDGIETTQKHKLKEEAPMMNPTAAKTLTALFAGMALAALPMLATAQEEGGTKTARELRASYDKALQGKTI